MKAEFDDFLFAQLGEDRNGLPLTVISLLARMNLDPWQEAKSLAAVSAEAAAKRLSFCLGTLTDPALIRRLLALLPSRSTPTAELAVGRSTAAAPAQTGLRLRTLFFIAAAIVLVGSQLLSAHRFGSSGVAGPVVPPAAVPVVPHPIDALPGP